MSQLFRYSNSHVTKRGMDHVIYAVGVYERSLWTVVTLKDPQLGYRQITILPDDLAAVIKMLQEAQLAIDNNSPAPSPASSSPKDPDDE